MTLKEKIDMIADPHGWKSPATGDKFYKIAKLLVNKGFTEDQACGLIREICDSCRNEDTYQ